MSRKRLAVVVGIAARAAAQNLSDVHTVTALDVALISNNVSANQQAAFQIYHSDFREILGSSPSLSMVLNDTEPYWHEAGVVTSDDPLTLYSTSNQFNTSTGSPSTNNKTIVTSRTTLDTATGEWTRRTVNNNTDPMFLANGGFPYRDGILFDVQGTLTEPGGLVYFPVTAYTADNTTTPPSTLINNYLGTPFNSPNDVYVTRNGVIYFTDPAVGYIQHIRPAPSLPPQVYAYVPNTTTVKPVADHLSQPNGITFSPDEKTVYITDSIGVDPVTHLPSYRTIYAYDVVYPSTTSASASANSSSSSLMSAEPTQGEVAFFANRRVFAMPSQGIPDGIKCDTGGNVYTGSADGINVYNPSGVLLGKIVVAGGTSNFGFASDGKILAMSEDRLWLVQLDSSVQPAVAVGERRG